MKKRWLAFAALPLFILTVSPVAAQTSGIYTCIDAQGKRHTSDRPIAACIDREQKRLSKTGVVQGVVPPSYTAEERAAIAARAKQEELQRQQERAKAKSMTALLQRYPTPAAHMAARKADTDPILTKDMRALNRSRASGPSWIKSWSFTKKRLTACLPNCVCNCKPASTASKPPTNTLPTNDKNWLLCTSVTMRNRHCCKHSGNKSQSVKGRLHSASE